MADPAAGKDPPPPASSAEQMPPPPRPRPSIITQAPSTSNIQLQSETNLPIDESIRPTNFNPFFILIDDVGGNGKTTAHPRKVHYIFEDDDTSQLLTDALVKASQQNSDTHSETSAEAEPEERVIILDLNATGDQVEKVTSLSPNWQVLGASVEKAPTLQEGEGERGGGGLMVRVEGVGVDGFVDGGIEGEEEGEGQLLGRWDGGMGVLGRVVGLCDLQEREEREREERRIREEQEGPEGEGNVRSGLEVSRGDLSRGHLSKGEASTKRKETERKDSLPEEDIGEG